MDVIVNVSRIENIVFNLKNVNKNDWNLIRISKNGIYKDKNKWG